MNPHSVVIVSNASIKNYVVTFISYIYLYNSPVIKTIHYVVNILSTEAKLFVIRYSINQAVCLSNINYIFVIINSNHAANRIFDSSLHLSNLLWQLLDTKSNSNTSNKSLSRILIWRSQCYELKSLELDKRKNLV